MPKKPQKLPRALLRRIRLLVLDVDGTLTDGRLYYGASGEALKAFDVRDGHGLRLLTLHAPVKLAVLTGRRADLVQQRCRELSIGHVVGQSRAKGRPSSRSPATWRCRSRRRPTWATTSTTCLPCARLRSLARRPTRRRRW